MQRRCLQAYDANDLSRPDLSVPGCRSRLLRLQATLVAKTEKWQCHLKLQGNVALCSIACHKLHAHDAQHPTLNQQAASIQKHQEPGAAANCLCRNNLSEQIVTETLRKTVICLGIQYISQCD
jgi:hypothetical protein